MNATILFVDDDSMVLNALERTFFESSFTTFFATSAPDAYDILEKNHVDLVVSDIRMLPISGEAFLREVKKSHPEIIRVVLSAYGDRNVMVKIICESLAQVYFLKPWDNQKLIDQLTHLISMHRSLAEFRNTLNIEIGEHLPLLPSLYTKMITMVAEEKSLKEIALLIETDPAATANILKLANSSFYGLTISSVHQALVYLGIASVKDIVLVSEMFSHPSRSPNEDLLQQTSNHMVCTSKFLHGLHQGLLAKKIPEEFSVAGLLADIGRLFMIEYCPEKYRKVLNTYINESTVQNLSELEAQEIGFSHTKLGALILDWWNMPASLIESGLCHHDSPLKTEILPEHIIKLIRIADVYTWNTIESKEVVTIDEDTLSFFSVNQHQIDEIIAAIIKEDDFFSSI